MLDRKEPQRRGQCRPRVREGLSVAAVGNALAGLSATDQAGVLNGLAPVTAGTPVATLLETVLKRISGTYRSLPHLNADLAGAPTGSYTGRMTVTFVQS